MAPQSMASASVESAFASAEANINKGASAPAPAPASAAAKAKKPVQSESQKEILNFKKFVENNGLALKNSENGKVYLMADAWQYLCAMKGVTPTFESAEETRTIKIKERNSYVEKSVNCVTTICRLIGKNGVEISRSTMVASSDEKFLKDKPLYAVWGMSQTRAMARAIKNVYGYVARAAGFQTTPWEEVQ